MKELILLSFVLLSTASFLLISAKTGVEKGPTSSTAAPAGMAGPRGQTTAPPAIASQTQQLLADAPPPEDKGTPGSRS